jgi:hypothetical protein
MDLLLVLHRDTLVAGENAEAEKRSAALCDDLLRMFVTLTNKSPTNRRLYVGICSHNEICCYTDASSLVISHSLTWINRHEKPMSITSKRAKKHQKKSTHACALFVQGKEGEQTSGREGNEPDWTAASADRTIRAEAKKAPLGAALFQETINRFSC